MKSASSLFLLLLPAVALASARVPASYRMVDSEPSALQSDAAACGLDEDEAALLSMLTGHPEQRRETLHCDPALQAFARMRAADMAEDGYFSHVTPDRIGPNAMLEAAGYPLPTLYSGRLANNIEAIAAGLPTAEKVFKELVASRSHREHLLAEHPFYEQQDEIGIAHVRDPESDYGDYWVIVIARRERPGEPRYLCTPEPGTCIALSPRD